MSSERVKASLYTCTPSQERKSWTWLSAAVVRTNAVLICLLQTDFPLFFTASTALLDGNDVSIGALPYAMVVKVAS